MTFRSTLVAVAIAAGLATPAAAQDDRTFEAWGHTYTVPVVIRAPRQDTILATGSSAPKRTYVSGNALMENETNAPVEATPTINVWGARFDAAR
jgi:hypothetical protein